MSKAFVNEDAVEPDAAEVLPARSSEPLPITPRGLARLRDELSALRASGAASTRRARILERALASVVVQGPALQAGGVGFGCVVEVEREDGVRQRYEIAGPDDAEPSAGRVSVASPLARALLGKKRGDVVTVAKPGGDVEIVVVDVIVPAAT